jgi:hypothetical protein
MRVSWLALAVLAGCSSTSRSRVEEVFVDAGTAGSGAALGADSAGTSGSSSNGSGGTLGAGPGGSAGTVGVGSDAGSRDSASGNGGTGAAAGAYGAGSVDAGGRAGSGGSAGGLGSDAGDAAASCTGKLDCDTTPGCETTNGTSRACGSCENQCSPRESCYQGTTCTLCPTDWLDCDGNSSNVCETYSNGKTCGEMFGGCSGRCHTWQICSFAGGCVDP